ncbi:hypothetical protein JCM18899A_38760 [Nocardioides sp. AN3]
MTVLTGAVTVESAPKYLYVDSSSLIRVAMGDHNAAALHRTIVAAGRSATLVSSRLLELEARRTSVRLALDGVDASPIDAWVKETTLLPIDDDVWRGAMRIRPHVKTLDSLHLATASLVPDCAMLTSDQNMKQVGRSLGIEVLDV